MNITSYMKYLYLVRHAKSSWDHTGLSDRERPLSRRGLRDAPAMGQRFADRGESVDLVLTSPAKRAQATAELVCQKCSYPVDHIIVDDDLYFLGSGTIEAVIRAQDDEVSRLMLVFHNPDITYFANAVGDSGDTYVANVPTCGLIKTVCDVGSWGDWTHARARCEYFDYPKNDSGDVIRT